MVAKPRNGRWQRLTALLLGVAFLAVGILGLVFPILPGWIFIFAALVSFAAAIPTMRRLASRLVTSGPARRVLESAARSPTGRRLMSMALRLPHVRRGLTTPARWQVVRTILREATEAQSRGEGT